MEAAIVAALAFHYGAAILLFGAALFRRLVPPERPDRRADARLRRGLALCAAGALLSAVALLMVEAASMAGDWNSALDKQTLAAVLGKTSFGAVWLGRLIPMVAAVLVAWFAPPRWAGVALGGAAVLASLALLGHPLALGGIPLAVNHAVHLLAAGAWLGALWPLAVRLAALRGDPSAAARCLRRFSNYGTMAVVALLITGAINALALGGPVAGLPASAYGQALLAKLALVAALVALALVNRLRLLPALARAPVDRAGKWVRASVLAEIAMGACVVLAASVLGTLPPPGS